MNKLLSSNSGSSTIRLVMLWSIAMATILLGIIVWHIVKQTIKCEVVDWNGLSLYLAAITAFIATTIFGKVWQKRYENGNNKHENNEA